MTKITTIAIHYLEDIKAVLNKELAEVTIEPRMDYYLDFGHRTPREYQNLLFQLREAVQKAIDAHCVQYPPPEESTCSEPLHAKARTCYRLVFYIIPDEQNPHADRELVLYETPYFENMRECVRYAATGKQAINLTWELSHYTSEPMIHHNKPAYLSEAKTRYAGVINDVREWLETGFDRPEMLLGNEEESEYSGHRKISEPKYGIDAYIRFERAEVVWD